MLIAVAGDMHLPWPNRRAVRAFIAWCRKHRPDIVVQIGDLRDMFAWGRFPRTQCVLTPLQEITQGTRMAEEFWSAVRAACGPQVERYQLMGNHDQRLAKQMFAKLPEFEPFLHDMHRQLWEFDGVITSPSERDEIIIDGICFMHGFRKHGEHAKHNGMSTVVGHSHRGGTVYSRLGKKTIWELNAGYLGDPKARALSYTSQLRFSQWTPGMGVIRDNVPTFVPL